jgi:hypothetical protein
MKFIKSFVTFTGKELTELRRSGRLLIFLILFVLLGVLNPATAKLTPWLLSTMADSLESSGITVTAYTVTAMDSWVQFFKNMPVMGLLVTVVMFGGIFTSEYARGTLIPLLSKGLPRSAVCAAKTFVMLLVWSAGYWLSYGITYAYSDYYWDNSVVQNYPFAAFGLWLFGVLLLCCVTFFSSFAGSAAQVLLGVGGVYVAMNLAGMVGTISQYLPSYLTQSGELLTGQAQPSDFRWAVIAAAAASVVLLAVSLPLNARRRV